MAGIAAAEAMETQREAVGECAGVLVDPGTLENSPELELIRERAASLNPMYQISCILSDLNA